MESGVRLVPVQVPKTNLFSPWLLILQYDKSRVSCSLRNAVLFYSNFEFENISMKLWALCGLLVLSGFAVVGCGPSTSTTVNPATVEPENNEPATQMKGEPNRPVQTQT